MGHIPLMVAWPGVAPGTNDALTTTVDIHATSPAGPLAAFITEEIFVSGVKPENVEEA